jgi:zinc D-Ala-D-Ala dipeptidase
MSYRGKPDTSIVLLSDSRVTAIPASDIGERLVDVRRAGLLVSSRQADDTGAFAHVREAVLDRLMVAERALPDGYHLMLNEGYRPPALQQRYFDDYRDTLREHYPDSDDEALYRLASRYVSPLEVAPHSAGAAVDVTLCTEDGTELDCGTPVNATPEESGGACYTAHPSLDASARDNRAVLGAALVAAGFVNYPTEWWHWSFGDRYWAMTTEAPAAIYGPAEMPR